MEDEWPVVAEHFGQWIVEDKFVDGRPAWEDVGVMFVPDVKPYEYMKLRLLNGTHSALSYVAHLSGFQFVDDALNHDPINDFVVCFMDETCHRCERTLKACGRRLVETAWDDDDPGRLTPATSTHRTLTAHLKRTTHTHSVPSVPGVDLEVYKKSLVTRFSNPYVKDKVERLMLDGSKKLLNTMRDAIAHLTQHGLPTTYLALAVAAYIRYVTGIDCDGEEIPEVLDPMAEELREPARNACRLRSLPPTPDRSANGTPANGEGGNGHLVLVEDAPVSDKVKIQNEVGSALWVRLRWWAWMEIGWCKPHPTHSPKPPQQTPPPRNAGLRPARGGAVGLREGDGGERGLCGHRGQAPPRHLREGYALPPRPRPVVKLSEAWRPRPLSGSVTGAPAPVFVFFSFWWAAGRRTLGRRVGGPGEGVRLEGGDGGGERAPQCTWPRRSWTTTRDTWVARICIRAASFSLAPPINPPVGRVAGSTWRDRRRGRKAEEENSGAALLLSRWRERQLQTTTRRLCVCRSRG